MILQFTIPGKVVAKQSFRYTRDGRKYINSDVKNYANWVRLCFKDTYPEHLPSVFFEKALGIEIRTYFEIPQGFSKKKRSMCLTGHIRPTVKPDTDNISKNIKDALNGIAYPDDKQVVYECISKYYGEEPYTLVTLKGFDNGN